MNSDATLFETIHLSETMTELIHRIDVRHLEEYVIFLLEDFVSSHGADSLQHDLHYDLQTPAGRFISDLMEIGSVQLLKENNLLHDGRFIEALYLIISAMSKVTDKFLKTHHIAGVAGYRYSDADPLYLLLERAVEHANLAIHDLAYLENLVQYQLMDRAGESLV